MAGGKQYVSVLAGYGGGVGLWSKTVYRGWKFGAEPRRLLTFALDGTAKLPVTAPADLTVHAVDDPKLVLDQARVERGANIYAQNCAMCHGGELLSAGVAPDLRESGVALDLAAFHSVVRGALLTAGMPKFEKLSEDEVGDVYQYVRAGAREALGIRRPSNTKVTGRSHF
jgi:quinohemoprotein ethanol dehydrogenase